MENPVGINILYVNIDRNETNIYILHDWLCILMAFDSVGIFAFVVVTVAAWGWPITLQWVHVRDGVKCSCYGKGWGEGTKLHHASAWWKILLKTTDWWDSRRFHEPSPHFGVSIYVYMYLYIDIQQYSLLHVYKYIYTHVSITSIVKLNTFLPPTFAPSSIFSVSDSPKTSSFLLQAEGCGSKRHQLQCLAERGNFVAL